MQPFKGIWDYVLKPGRFIRAIFSKNTLNNLISQFTNPGESDELKALSAAFGIFIGIIPIWGLQTFAAIFLAVAFRLNKALVVVFSQISFPPLLPVIVFLSYRVGEHWMGNNVTEITSKASFIITNTRLEQYIYGSITLAVIASIAVGLLTYMIIKLSKALKQYKLANAYKKLYKQV